MISLVRIYALVRKKKVAPAMLNGQYLLQFYLSTFLSFFQSAFLSFFDRICLSSDWYLYLSFDWYFCVFLCIFADLTFKVDRSITFTLMSLFFALTV